MGLGETSNFSIFTFSCAGDLQFCTHSYSNCLSHDEVLRFEQKRLQSDNITLWYSIQRQLRIPLHTILRIQFFACFVLLSFFILCQNISMYLLFFFQSSVLVVPCHGWTLEHLVLWGWGVVLHLVLSSADQMLKCGQSTEMVHLGTVWPSLTPLQGTRLVEMHRCFFSLPFFHSFFSHNSFSLFCLLSLPFSFIPPSFHSSILFFPDSSDCTGRK